MSVMLPFNDSVLLGAQACNPQNGVEARCGKVKWASPLSH